MKKFNQISQKLSAAVAVGVFAASAFVLSACGGGDKAESYVKEKYPNAKILSFSEIQKEFGLKDKECLVEKGDFIHRTYYFAKIDGELEVLEVETQQVKDGPSRISKSYSIDEIKAERAECFN